MELSSGGKNWAGVDRADLTLVHRLTIPFANNYNFNY